MGANQNHQFTDGLVKNDGGSIVIGRTVPGGCHGFQMARCPADRNCEEILEGCTDFDTDDIFRNAWMIG